MSGHRHVLWGFGSTRSRIYWTLRMVPAGLVWNELIKASGVRAKAVENALVDLQRDGYVTQAGGRGSAYLACPDVHTPYELESLGRMLLWSLVEFPGGISSKLLAQDTNVSEAEVYFGLQEALLSRKAVKCWLPSAEANNREIGYKPRDEDEAQLGQMPVPSFEHHGLHANFALQADGQVSVRWGTALAVLPGPVVREFFAFMAEASLTAVQRR